MIGSEDNLKVSKHVHVIRAFDNKIWIKFL